MSQAVDQQSMVSKHMQSVQQCEGDSAQEDTQVTNG